MRAIISYFWDYKWLPGLTGIFKNALSMHAWQILRGWKYLQFNRFQFKDLRSFVQEILDFKNQTGMGAGRKSISNLGQFGLF